MLFEDKHESVKLVYSKVRIAFLGAVRDTREYIIRVSCVCTVSSFWKTSHPFSPNVLAFFYFLSNNSVTTPWKSLHCSTIALTMQNPRQANAPLTLQAKPEREIVAGHALDTSTKQQQLKQKRKHLGDPDDQDDKDDDLDGYKKISKIGEGTYGVVFKALKDQKVVALKKIKLNYSDGMPVTTMREIAILKELNHRNVLG